MLRVNETGDLEAVLRLDPGCHINTVISIFQFCKAIVYVVPGEIS